MKEISLTIMLLTIGFTLANCTSNKNNIELNDSKTWMDLEFADSESLALYYADTGDYSYDTSDILNPRVGKSSATYYAVENKDTFFVKTYLDILDTIDFERFILLCRTYKHRVFDFDPLIGANEEEHYSYIEQENIQFNTMFILKKHFASCLLFDHTNGYDCLIKLEKEYAFYDRPYNQTEMKEITEIINEPCKINRK